MGLLNPQKPFFLEIVLVSKTKSFKSYNITEHLKNFEYSVVSEDGGALTYKIDVINPMESVEELFKEYLIHYYADIRAEKHSWFPQILIQWGYGKEKEDGISKVHLATISDLKYTFSSGKEKVLSITAVGDASFADDYVQGFLKARWYGPKIKKSEEDLKREMWGIGEWKKWQGWDQYEGSNLVFTDVIQDVLGQHLKQFPRTEVNLTQINWKGLELILRKKYHEYVLENTKPEFHVINADKYAYRKKAAAKKHAAFTILEYFGFQVNYTPLTESYKTGYYGGVYSKIGQGPTGEFIPDLLAKDQVNAGGLKAMTSIIQATKARISSTSLDLPVTPIEDFYGGEGFDPDENTTYTIISSPDEITEQTAFGTGFSVYKVFLVKIRSGNGREFTANATEAGAATIESSVKSRTKAALENNKKFQDMITREAQHRLNVNASMPESVTYDTLTAEEKADIYGVSQLIVSWDSPEGTPLKKTILELMERINALLEDPEESLTMYTQSPPLFIERGKGTLQQVWGQHVKSRKDVTRITVTQRSKVGEKDYKDSDMEIFSYPQLNIEGKPFSTSRLTYGGDDSTVRFFDFTSDLAYMSQSLQGIVSILNMGNNAEFLTHERIERSLFYFVEKLSDSDKIIKDSELKKKLRSDIAQQKERGLTAIELTEDTLAFLKGLQSKIRSAELQKIFRNADKAGHAEDTESFKAFLLMLQRRASVAEFFEIKGGKYSSSYQVLFGDEEKTFDTNSDIAYTLKKNNIFSQYSKEGFSQRKLIKAFSSDYLRGFPTQVRVKSLGIPELDTVMDVSNLRSIALDVHDLSKERITGVRNIHWISGTYTPFEIKHTVSPSEGYLTEISLLRNSLGTSPREDNNA